MFKTIPIIALLSLFLVFPAFAQEKGDIKPSQMERIIDIDFPGGTIPFLLDMVEKKNGFRPNVIISEEAAKLMLPPFRLRAASILQMLIGIERLGRIDNQEIRMEHFEDVATLMVIPRPQMMGTQEHSSNIFHMGAILSYGYSIDDLVTGIETAWKMRLPNHSAQLKYHQETELLIATGTRADIVVVSELLQELTRAKEEQLREEKIKQEVPAIQQTLTRIQESINKIWKRLEEQKKINEMNLKRLELLDVHLGSDH